MKKILLLLLLTTGTSAVLPLVSFAQTAPPTVLTGIKDESVYSQFATLVRSANLGATLSGLGTYTVFAPHNLIFRALSPEKSDTLANNPARLAMILKAHIVKGIFKKADIDKRLGLGKGQTTLTNLLGQPLKLSVTKDSKLFMTDVNGNKAFFLEFDVPDPHGVIHGIDNLLLMGK